MNLPNYFLADLEEGASLSAELIREACETLKRNRERYLAERTTRQMIRLLSEVGRSWLDRDYPFRKMALEQGEPVTGFSSHSVERGLDNFFKQVTSDNLERLVVEELGDLERLDKMVAEAQEKSEGRAALALGPDLLVHVAAGNVPNPVFMSIILGFLARSAQFVKCASGTAFLPRLFAHSLYEADPKLGACLEVAEWKGGALELEEALFGQAQCLTATGSDETLKAIRNRLPAGVRFVGHGEKVSFGYICRESLEGRAAGELARETAEDVVAWNQLGCLSPHVIYTERGGALSPEDFAGLLAQELERREQFEPRGAVSAQAAAAIASRRNFYEVRAAHSPGATRKWQSEGSTAWTVIYEAEPRFQLSCLHRFVYVKPVSGLKETLENSGAVYGKVSTVGLAAPAERIGDLVVQLARWGVTRICPLGAMQNPPLIWRHDGRPPLGDLILWADWER
jgi:hypothetical protein